MNDKDSYGNSACPPVAANPDENDVYMPPQSALSGSRPSTVATGKHECSGIREDEAEE